MKILVTGSNGFIGQHICKELVKQHEVIGIGTQNTGNLNEINYYKGHIESDDFVDEFYVKLFKIDIIIHLAAYLNTASIEDKLIDVNCKGMTHICELGKRLNVKQIINFSSLPIIGKPKDIPITEKHLTCPNTLYHVTKLMAEHIGNLYLNDGIKVVHLRISSPIGLGMRKNSFLQIILNQCIENKTITVYGQGLREQNYIDVRDIVQAVLQVIKYEVEGTYNIASEHVISNIDLVKLCHKLTKSESEITYCGMDADENYCWQTSIDKAKNDFMFAPKYSLTDTIEYLIKGEYL